MERRHLARPWGERLIQAVFNRLEMQYPVVDNVAEEGVGVKDALSADHPTNVGDAAP